MLRATSKKGDALTRRCNLKPCTGPAEIYCYKLQQDLGQSSLAKVGSSQVRFWALSLGLAGLVSAGFMSADSWSCFNLVIVVLKAKQISLRMMVCQVSTFLLQQLEQPKWKNNNVKKKENKQTHKKKSPKSPTKMFSLPKNSTNIKTKHPCDNSFDQDIHPSLRPPFKGR